MQNLNDFFTERKQLTFGLMWLFFAIALGIAIGLNVIFPAMGVGKFYAILAAPAIIAVYFRVMYGRARTYAKEQEALAADLGHPVAKAPKKQNPNKKKKLKKRR